MITDTQLKNGNSDRTDSGSDQNTETSTLWQKIRPVGQKTGNATTNPDTKPEGAPEQSDETRIEKAADALGKVLSKQLNKELNTAPPLASSAAQSTIRSEGKSNGSPSISPRLVELQQKQKMLAGITGDSVNYELMLHRLQDKFADFSQFLTGTETDLQQLDQLETDNKSLSNSLEITTRQLEEAKQQIATLHSVISEHEAGKAEGRRILDNARKELIHAIEAGKIVSSELESKEQALSRQQSDISKLKDACEQKFNENLKLTRQSEQLVNKSSKLSEATGKVEKENELLKSKQTKLLEERDQALQRTATLYAEIGSKNQIVASQTGQLDAARHQLKTAAEDFEIKSRHREGEIIALRSSIVNAEEQLGEKDEQLESSRLQVIEFRSRITNETDKRFELEKAQVELQEKITEIEKALDAAQADNDKLNTRYLHAKSDLEKHMTIGSDSTRPMLEGSPALYDTPKVQKPVKKAVKKPVAKTQKNTGKT